MHHNFFFLILLSGIGFILAEYTVSVTFFNVDNPDDVIAGVLPVLSQKGPYVYRLEKDLVNQAQEGDLLSFGELKYHYFAEDLSCDGCSESDEVQILNAPLIGVVKECLTQGTLIGSVLCGLVETALNGEYKDDLFFTHTVGDLLFNGVDTGIVEFLMTNAITSNRLPPQIGPNGFAFLNGKNATTDNNWYTLDTNPTSYNIEEWGPQETEKHQDLSFTRWWPSPDASGEVAASTCNRLVGTDGSQYYEGITEDTKIWQFSPETCRSSYFTFESELEEDPNFSVFTRPAKSFHINRTDNFCFCPSLDSSCFSPTDDPDVLDLSGCDLEGCYDGLLDVYPCYQSPVILSNPNFYLAEHQLVNFQGSISSDKQRDESKIVVNRNSGEVLQSDQKLQINLPIVKHPKVTILENVPDIIFPIMWVNNAYSV